MGMNKRRNALSFMTQVAWTPPGPFDIWYSGGEMRLTLHVALIGCSRKHTERVRIPALPHIV